MQFILWLVLPPLLVYGSLVWLFRTPERGVILRAVKRAHDLLWGEYRRFRQGKLWEPGEQEVFRAELLEVSAYSIDRHIRIQQRSTCIVTNHRFIVRDDRGSAVQLVPDDIRTVRAQRTYDVADGFSYAVVVERVGSRVLLPEGDLRLVCSTQAQSYALAAAIEGLSSVLPQSPAHTV